jgi:hypothetical protein
MRRVVKWWGAEITPRVDFCVSTIALQHTPSTFEQNLRFPDALEVSTEFDKIMIEIIYFEYLRRLSE